MKTVVMKVERQWPVNASKKIDVEVFESTSEAIAFLGEAQALKLLNYAHEISARSRAHRELDPRSSTPTKRR